MNEYFSNFPLIDYDGQQIRNITLRTKIVDSFKNNSTNFYSYTLKDGETADSLAYNYYGDSNLVWVIYMANDIIDPYYDWPLSNLEFDRFIINKYGSIEEAKQTIAYYKKLPTDYYINDITNEFILASLYNPNSNGYGWTKVTIDDNIKIVADSNPNPALWSAVDVYADEFQQNEQKRYIKLLDSRFVIDISNRLKEIMYA